MPTNPETDLLLLARKAFMRSNADRKHPFRYFWLATSVGNLPEIRTVVNRKVHPDLSIRFYTDSRSPKMGQMRAQPQVSALFYHPRQQLQVRVRATASILNPSDPTHQTLLQQLTHTGSLKDYTTSHAPGSPLAEASTAPAADEIHFAVVELHPLEMDVLLLDREMHQRCLYTREGDTWTAQPLVP